MTDRDPAAALVRKLWQYCNVLRDDGLSYPDYVEQLTYLLFLKMSDERAGELIPAEFAWKSFAGLDAAELHRHYGQVLASLGEHPGTLGLIFRNAKNKITDPAKLRLLVVELIGQTEWTGLSTDLKGDAYEGLLEKNARDTKSGAGQYFTPRPLIEAIVECIAPAPGEVIADPACGTAGFLLTAHQHVSRQLSPHSRSQLEHLRTKALRGIELVPEVARLAAMNLMLHGVWGESDDELPISCADSLREPPAELVDVVLTNPPFGIRGSITYAGNERRSSKQNDDLYVHRPDFWVETANKQLNFLQHIIAMLKAHGRAAVVLPDNVLFETGAASVVRRRLLETCTLHTILRLPTGLFYAAGVKANVLFFQRHDRETHPRNAVWVYDLRSEGRFSLKTRPIARTDLAAFLGLYQGADETARREAAPDPRWRPFDQSAILADKDCRLDLSWRADEANSARRSGLERLDELSALIADDLQRALALITKPQTK